MNSDTGAIVFAFIFVAGLCTFLGFLVGSCCGESNIERQAINHGYAKDVKVDGSTRFQWKERDES